MRANLKARQIAIAILFLSLALTPTFAQTPPADSSLTANSVYQKNCAKCHGKTAGGHHFGGPSLISDKTAAASTEDLRNIIASGKGHMPKYAGKLTAEEIDTLVRQIQAMQKK
jgi:mono/diheme cytochrome c family protein